MLLVFVHGYSVTSFDTYGGLPARLQLEANARAMQLRTADIFLGRYISFSDQVLLSDLARALEHAVREQLPSGERCVFVTHSTGGPLVRTWWHHYYFLREQVCPMSHLVMLAPANHGSALAQLGKSKLSRLRSWLEGLEPGEGVLHWLELGSKDAWELNNDWVYRGTEQMKATGTFPFVLTGQDIDRKMYDHINSYTGEDGSDGAVRVASANLNNAFLRLKQNTDDLGRLEVEDFRAAAEIPFKILYRRSHSGNEMGIMRSVRPETEDLNSKEIVDAIFDCIAVRAEDQFRDLERRFDTENRLAQERMRIEVARNSIRDKIYFHDRHSMVIFRVMDHEGRSLADFDLLITGDDNDPDQLPVGFFADRQCNKVHANTLTYYFNYDIMTGNAEIKDANGNILRPANQPLRQLGLKIVPRPGQGFVRYLPCSITASAELFSKIVRPNATTHVEIILERLLSDENFRFEKLNPEDTEVFSFKHVKPGTKNLPGEKNKKRRDQDPQAS